MNYSLRSLIYSFLPVLIVCVSLYFIMGQQVNPVLLFTGKQTQGTMTAISSGWNSRPSGKYSKVSINFNDELGRDHTFTTTTMVVPSLAKTLTVVYDPANPDHAGAYNRLLSSVIVSGFFIFATLLELFMSNRRVTRWAAQNNCGVVTIDKPFPSFSDPFGSRRALRVLVQNANKEPRVVWLRFQFWSFGLPREERWEETRPEIGPLTPR
jgi:hypothetical protein